MKAILQYLKDYKNFKQAKIENYENLILPFIESDFFLWVCVILLLNRKNWKRPVILILIIHWFLRSFGNLLRNTMDFREKEENMIWPYSMKNWYISQALAHIFWLTGEIIGDWYPLLRTKAVTKDKKKIRIVYCTCILYNLAKVNGMTTFYTSSADLRAIVNGKTNNGLSKFNLYWWISIGIMQITSCIYDISVIYALKTGLFNKLKEYSNFSKNTFMDKFKSISELRIICSMAISLMFLPFLAYFIYHLVKRYHAENLSGQLFIDSQIEQFRQVVLSSNFTMMYIDQILLRSFVEKNKTAHTTKNNKSFNSTNNTSLNMINISQDYSELTKYNDSEHSQLINPPEIAYSYSYNDTSFSNRTNNTYNDTSFSNRTNNTYNDTSFSNRTNNTYNDASFSNRHGNTYNDSNYHLDILDNDTYYNRNYNNYK